MEEEQDIERISYISEMHEILKILRDIPPENVLERATFEGRLDKIAQEYREKILKNLDDLNPILLGYVEDEREMDYCQVCSNENVACTCMSEDGVD
jgi:hypothetical protein